ncbi:CooT family nickel-binding protein [Desulfoglaeba alkanexedens ALDC]|uniref:CooT family nickel-binding protein n=1 Tax=Desulfoglaeba alkanexedens ALDC TaxID=980445 RepID=A0A4P8LAA0_9BACT|nr:CooT family nickel-binding protein [Desulfoglaeba alkanexedens ALDC]
MDVTLLKTPLQVKHYHGLRDTPKPYLPWKPRGPGLQCPHLTNIFGERKVVQGTIHSMSLVNHKIPLESRES